MITELEGEVIAVVVVLTIVNVLFIVSALIMTVTVLLQSSDEDGLSAITGGAGKQFSRSKAKSIEEKLALVTKCCAIAFVALCFVSMFISPLVK